MNGNDSLGDLKKSIKEFSALMRKVNSVTRIDPRPLTFKRDVFYRMRSGVESRLHLAELIRQACHANIFEDAYRLISLTQQSYDQFKRIFESRYSTHRYITEQALKLVDTDRATSSRLMEYCTFPDDRKSDMQDLIFEGHFFGQTHNGSEGNFIGNLFPLTIAVLEAIKKATHGSDEDIEENAVLNFAENFAGAGNDEKGCTYLGVAAHYLQDLTAPHHVGNYPAVPYVDHYFFEKFASQYVYSKPNFQITSTSYSEFKRSLTSSPSEPEAFAREIYGRAVEFVPFIKTNLHSESPETDDFTNALDEAVDTCNRYLVSGGNEKWEKAIDNAVPLAIHATAYLFETALKGGVRTRRTNKMSVESVLPVITLDTIAPPYLKYPYFEGCEARLFRPQLTVFDMQNAWWLIEASTLVYADPEFVAEHFQKAGLNEMRFFDGEQTDTQAFVASNNDFVIVAFRGTEIRRRSGEIDFRNVLADIATDAHFGLVDSGQGGRVHEGFKKALDEVWEKRGLFQYIKDISRKGMRKLPVWFTGHSLGAALATLAADRYGDVRGLYTFGSPRVGDADFKGDFHINTYRFLNNNDIVARVPPAGPYLHVGDLKYIDHTGRIHDNSTLWERAAESITNEALRVFNCLGRMRIGFDDFIPDCIIDHVPLLYAAHIWNNIP